MVKMPLTNFDGKTFVAFIDISGFKHLMKNGKAWEALDKLYKYGYEVLKGNNNLKNRVEGLFVSDCGILFVRYCQNNLECLKAILKVVKEINKKMLNHDFLLTTSIAYGHFKYQERIEFEGIDKNTIYGNAYVSAFIDNENGKPNIQPGQCRIVNKNLSPNIIQNIKQNSRDEILRMIRKRDDKDHYYFYWMREDPSEIERFEKEYSKFEKMSSNSKYTYISKVLKGVYDVRQF